MKRVVLFLIAGFLLLLLGMMDNAKRSGIDDRSTALEEGRSRSLNDFIPYPEKVLPNELHNHH